MASSPPGGMLIEGVNFDKILALLPLKMLIFLQFISAKQGFHSSTSLKFFRDARAEAVSRQKEFFSGASCYVTVKVCFLLLIVPQDAQSKFVAYNIIIMSS